jgi:hypothetical protein
VNDDAARSKRSARQAARKGGCGASRLAALDEARVSLAYDAHTAGGDAEQSLAEMNKDRLAPPPRPRRRWKLQLELAGEIDKLLVSIVEESHG